MAHPSTIELIQKIFEQPTAPFREGWVSAELKRFLNKSGVSYFEDRAGNLIAGVSNARDLLKPGFKIALMAHMDHPGFHLEKKIKGATYQCRWLGGAPFAQMLGARVRIYDPQAKGRTCTGTIVKVCETSQEHGAGRRIDITFTESLKDYSSASFGGFDFAGFEPLDDLVKTRAADDLAGCAIALGALLDQAQAKQTNLIAIFTRAEEVGFIGCMHLLKSKILPPDLWLISLEASKALPEAEPGRGPVLRIGDSRSLFDAEFSSVLWQVAKELESETAKSENPFRYQRRLMSGGMCEGTPLTVYGHQVAAVAVPLLNYHNGGEHGPAPEMISSQDVDQARRLCATLGNKLKARPDWRGETKREILRVYKSHHGYLKPRIAYDLEPEAE